MVRAQNSHFSRSKSLDSGSIGRLGSIDEFKRSQTLGATPSSSPLQIQQTKKDYSTHSQFMNEETKTGPFSEPPTESFERAINIKTMLEQAHKKHTAQPWEKFCIYRVPPGLREGQGKVFTPQMVSIGPYHHKKEDLSPMDHHKRRILHRILERNQQDVTTYLKAIKEVEASARACYEEPISQTSDKFVEMLVLDGCFILELFRSTYQEFETLGYRKNDPIFARRGSMYVIQRDVIMLENQIPMFVLDKLLQLQSGKFYQEGLLAKLAHSFCDPLIPTNNSSSAANEHHPTHSYNDPATHQGNLHCLGAFRASVLGPGASVLGPGTRLVPSKNETFRHKRKQQLVHCATDLENTGIRFERAETGSFCDIKFRKGKLQIPPLFIDDGTKSVLLNLIAFEKCHTDCTNDITSYVIFMDNLINSPADVSCLHRYGIIEYWLGSETEVAELFNCLCREVAHDLNNSYLSILSQEVNDYHDEIWNTWWATLKHKYFSNPWSFISLAGAIALLVLTFLQTFYTIYACFKHKS